MTRICWKKDNETHRGARRPWKSWRLVTAWAVALAIAAIILLAFRNQTESATELRPSEPATYQRYDDGGWPEPGACAPGVSLETNTHPLSQAAGQVPSRGVQPEAICLTSMTVGRVADDTSEFPGYLCPEVDSTGVVSTSGSAGESDFS